MLSLQGVRSASFALGVTAVLIAVLFGLGGNFDDSIFVYSICFAIVLVGMVVQVGYSHQLAFHQSVFMMAGAYGVAILNTRYHYPVWSAMILAVLGCAILGGLIGSYVTRVPGFALALATLFLSTIVYDYVSYNQWLGALQGLGPIPSVWNGGSYDSTFEKTGLIVVLLLGLAVFVSSRVIKSGIGLELALMSTNDRMAEAVGILTHRRRLELFIYGSGMAGLGGAVYACSQHFVTPDTFSQTAEITLLVMLYFGGRLSLGGGLIGAFAVEYISGISNFVAENQGIIEGVLITGVLLFFPTGIIGIVDYAKLQVLALYRKVRSGRQGAPSAPAGSIDSERTIALETAIEAIPTLDDEVEVLGPSHAPVLLDAAWSKYFSSSITNDSGIEDAARIECQEVTRRFDGVVAVDEVSLAIRGLGVHAICGPNGAGKSTLFEVIAGGQKADGGRILIDGRDVTKTSAAARAQLGLARTFQTVRLMNSQSILDNVAVAALESHRTFLTRTLVRSELNEARERAREALRLVGIEELASRRPGQLTLESQRMAELARAVVAHPRIMLLDEPASGLSAEQRARLAATLEELGKYITIVLVEHDLQMVMRISKEIFVLIEGRLMFQGTSEEFLASTVVRTELMGLVADQSASGALA